MVGVSSIYNITIGHTCHILFLQICKYHLLSTKQTVLTGLFIPTFLTSKMLQDWCEDMAWWASYWAQWAVSVTMCFIILISHLSHLSHLTTRALPGSTWRWSQSLSRSFSVWPMEGTARFAQSRFVTKGPVWRQQNHLWQCHNVTMMSRIMSVCIFYIKDKLNQSMH